MAPPGVCLLWEGTHEHILGHPRDPRERNPPGDDDSLLEEIDQLVLSGAHLTLGKITSGGQSARAGSSTCNISDEIAGKMRPFVWTCILTSSLITGFSSNGRLTR